MKWVVGIYLSLFAVACAKKVPVREVQPAFYHWESTVDIDSLQANFLQKTGIRQLYIRCFDLDWDGGSQSIIPVGEVQPNPKLPPDTHVIPTVFITNRSFTNIPSEQLPQLAQRVAERIQLRQTTYFGQTLHEVQFDCDWTQSTRSAFFRFLELVRAQLPVGTKISVTIRLHQIKFAEQTGVPPVDRGMLMCYNVGDLEDPNTENSIFAADLIKPYLARLDEYPLPLDLALPLFRWGVVFRDAKLVKLISDLDATDLADSTRFRAMEDQQFTVTQSTFLDGYYLYKNDRIRLESVAASELEAVTRLLAANWNETDTLRLAFYDLDSLVTQRYTPDFLQKLTKWKDFNPD